MIRTCGASGAAACTTTTAKHVNEGGIARWLRLTDGLGLDRDYVVSLRGLLPATRFAVDAYVNFVREKHAARSGRLLLTELFSPEIISERIEGMLQELRFRERGDARLLRASARRRPSAISMFALDYVKQPCQDAETSRPRCCARSNSSATCCGRCSTRLHYCYVAPAHILARARSCRKNRKVR